MTNRYRNAREIHPSPQASTRTTQAGPPAVKALLALLAATVLIVSGLGYFAVGRIGNEVTNAGQLQLGGGGKGFKGKSSDGAVDILLVGSDSRSDAQGNPLTRDEITMLRAGDEEGTDNTDTLMVIRIPDDGSSATAISVPRDTYIHDPEFGNMKINGVYGAHKHAREEELAKEGKLDARQTQLEAKRVGRQGLIHAISDLTGISVDHYAEIGLLGFVLLTDAVGGVDVCLNNAVNEPLSGAHFPAGRQTLNGSDALSFVRQRHELPRGDLDRIVRQQAFMASLVNKVLATGTLTNPSKLSEMGAAVERSVVLDDGWDVMSFANQLQNLAGGNVTFTTIPVTSIDGVGDYGESIVTVDRDQVHRFMHELLKDDKIAPGKPNAPEDGDHPEGELAEALGDTSIHVLNAGGPTGLAGKVAHHLVDEGASVRAIANAQPGVYTHSQVVAADPQNPAALALADKLGGLPVTSNPGLDSTTIIVVTATDYNGPASDSPIDESDLGSHTGQVGQPGNNIEGSPSPKIDAGGDGPRCVN